MDGDFEDFVRERGTALLRIAWLLTGHHADAEDLLQEALAGLARHWDRVSGEGSPEAYVRRALHHGAIDGWRRRAVRPRVVGEPTGHEAAVGDAFEDTDRRVVLRDALMRLTPRQRAVLVLRFYEQHTEVETAAVLGCSPNTVKSQTRHALKRLRELAPELAATFEREEATS
ncbi:SigE family RNA polymerase sigma factor [Janibacter sp. YB324]|uniref:SigE family RNA polymerase sigma factor n=1 Tax=Janibacter sp. YB324 TaxID=2761047 RepID=UPI001CB9C979|nr:SigE family RNA polymerase sigma factor [Janibacter sp. YB324]